MAWTYSHGELRNVKEVELREIRATTAATDIDLDPMSDRF